MQIDREDFILESIEGMVGKMREERQEMESRLERSARIAQENIEQMAAQVESTAAAAQEKFEALHKDAVETMQKLEENVTESVQAMEKKVDVSHSAVRTMTAVAIFGFSAVTLAVMVLFFTLLTNI